MGHGYGRRVEIPKEAVNDFRWRVKKVPRQQMQGRSLTRMIQELASGGGQLPRHCVGARRILSALDWYVCKRPWLRGKH